MSVIIILIVLAVWLILRRGKKKKVEKAQEQQPPVAIKQEAHRVAGVSYRQDAIRSLGTPNYDYELSTAEAKEEYEVGTRVYEYLFSVTPKLVLELDNPTGKPAVRVEANGVHIGYIKSGSSTHVRELMEEGRIVGMDLEIGGGPYKMLVEVDDDKYAIEKDSTIFWAKLTLDVIQEVGP